MRRRCGPAAAGGTRSEDDSLDRKTFNHVLCISARHDKAGRVRQTVSLAAEDTNLWKLLKYAPMRRMPSMYQVKVLALRSMTPLPLDLGIACEMFGQRDAGMSRLCRTSGDKLLG